MTTSKILVFALALVFLCSVNALPTIAPAGVDCGNGLSCASGQSCLSNVTGAGELMACSIFPNAVFCHDARFSCPAGTKSCGQDSKCTAADGSFIADATMNADASAVAKFRNFGSGMIEVKNVVCRIPLPGICSCRESGRIGAHIECSVGIPLSGGLTVGASAEIDPCGDPAAFGYWAWIGNQVWGERWTAWFNMNFVLPAPPGGFSLGFGAVKTRVEISGNVRRGQIEANLALGVCGRALWKECCNRDCPWPMSRAALPIRLITGTHDFSDLC